LPSYPVDENTSETKAIEAVRSQITAMVKGGNHKAWRSQQVARQLIDILTQLIDIGSVAIAVSLGAAILSEQFLTDKLEEQRQQVQKKLELSVDKAFNEYCDRIFERLRKIYQQIAEDIQRQQVTWQSAKTAAIEVSHPDSDEQPWQQMLDKASALKQEILAAVETSNH